MKIAVYFETTGHADLVRIFNTEEEYLKQIDKLETLAVNEGYGYVTERWVTNEELLEELEKCSGVRALYPRVCDITGKGVGDDGGYLVGDDTIIKDEKNLIALLRSELCKTHTFKRELTDAEILELAYEEEMYFWTTWSIDDASDDFYIEFNTGEVVNIEDFNDFV